MPLSSSYIRDLVGAYQATNKRYEEQRAAAIRWQGAQDYENMVRKGADPREALRRTAPRLFFNDPRALAATIPSMLSQPGGLVTDPQSGRQFTVDRFGNYKPVSEPTTYRKFTDAQGNTWTLAVPAGQVPQGLQPGVQPPQMYQTGGQNFLLQSGRQPMRVPRTEEQKIAGRLALERATSKAKSIFDRILSLKKAKQQGWESTRYGLPFVGSKPIDDEITQLEKDLAGLGFLPSGQPKPGTDLYRSVFGEEGQAPAQAGELPPGNLGAGATQGGMEPPVQAGQGYASPIGPARPPIRQNLIANPRYGASPYEPRMIPAGPATRGGVPTAGPSQGAPAVQLGPNEVIKWTEKGTEVIYNTQTGAVRRK